MIFSKLGPNNFMTGARILHRTKSIFSFGIFASISSIEPRKTFKRFSGTSFKAELILVADIAKESVSTRHDAFYEPATGQMEDH